MANDETTGSKPSASGSTASAPSANPLKASDAIAQDFLAATDSTPSGGRPIIQWKAGELPRVVDEAEAALMQCQHDILFQRGPQIVRVVRRQAQSVRQFKRAAGGLGISMVDKPYLVEQMTRAAVFEKYDGRREAWQAINAPEIVAQTYLARSGHWKLPRLLGVISTPTLRPDGTLLQQPGYDADTATWYDSCGMKFPQVPAKPTQKQAQAAADLLLRSLKTIPFVSPCDASVVLALMLTALVRRSLPSAPMGAITAPTPSSGKTMVADCISILATGVAASAMQLPSTDEEAEKVALTLLMGGDPVVLIDNIERPLRGAWLCTILTSEEYQGRMLGRNEMIKVPTTTLFLATGNKLVIQGDLRFRALLCRINPNMENPAERKFDEDLKDVFIRNRGELVAAALTLMRGYIVAGERADVFRESRFRVWSKFCREPLLWLGLNDPLDSYDEIEQNDPDRQQHVQMIAAWKAAFGGQPKTAREAISDASLPPNEDLRYAIEDVARDRSGALSAKSLAKWLSAHDGRIVAESMFVRHPKETRNGVTLWKVTDVKN